MENRPPFYYYMCNHGTQGGIGFAFPFGIHKDKKYQRSFFSAYGIYKVLDAVDAFPGLRVSMELDSYAYEEVLREDPACIRKLKEYIREGKVAPAGGTYGQPLGQDYGWEPNIRQLIYGRKVVKDILNYDVQVFLVEEQWFHPQLPQLLKQSGFRYASLQNQNSGQVKPLNEAVINWVGIDQTAIPTIPANNLLVSCVRQYTDYTAFAQRLKEYDHPLFFQWVEIWPPGMDWGASVTPFARAIDQVAEWQGKMVFLEEFFREELPHRDLQDIYIRLDESNYANNWYQGGGWGYDGDKVIMEDKLTESALITSEIVLSLAALNGSIPFPSNKMVERWKKMMVLENHDFSVARNYRAITDEGLTTEAGSLAVVEYQRLRKACQQDTLQVLNGGTVDSDSSKIIYFNSTGVQKKATVEFEINTSIAAERLVLRQNGEEIPFQVTEQSAEQTRGIAVIDLPALGLATVDIGESTNEHHRVWQKPTRQTSHTIEDDNYQIAWHSGTWIVEISDKKRDQSVEFKGFTGLIAKQNEHNYLFPALSPAHEKFSFAFDGTVHSPDQLADVDAYISERGPLRSTLVLRSNLLTLHTTDTPVAFAEARVSLNHVTGQVECESYLYAGVYLALQCHAVFKHNITHARYYRDFPFGEEETTIEDIYPNTYLRVVEGNNKGFTLIHPGVQRVHINRSAGGGVIRHLLARDKVFGEYRWKFDLWFGRHSASESARLSKIKHGYFPQVSGDSEFVNDFLQVNHGDLLLSTIYYEAGDLFIRFVNFSENTLTGIQVTLAHRFQGAEKTDFLGQASSRVELRLSGDKSILALPALRPWEIITIKLTP